MAGGTKPDEKKATRNIGVVIDFRKYWERAGKDLLLPNSDVLEFRASITFKSEQNSVQGETTVVRIHLAGYQETGMVDIIESENLTTEDFHLRFLPGWGDYSLSTESGELIIRNSSGKMGSYSVRIMPI